MRVDLLLVRRTMLERIIQNFVIVVAIGAIGAWVARRALSSRAERNNAGHLVLTYPLRLRLLVGGGCGLIALFSFILPISVLRQRDAVDPIFITVWWSVGAWMTCGVFRYVFTRIELRKDGFVSRGAWRSPTFIQWSDITQVSWSPQFKWFVIKTSHRTTVRASLSLSGILELHRALRRQVPTSAWKSDYAGFQGV